MSYDVSVYDEHFNYTFNMREFFVDYGVYPPDWQGKHRAVVGAAITDALRRVDALSPSQRSVEAQKYDAPNGWGSFDTAVEWLRRVLDACNREYSDIVEASK